MTNSLLLITVVLTNWVSVPGDFKREGGTNYLRERLMVVSNTYVEEIVLCTNRTHIKTTVLLDTNAPARWTVQPVGALPPGVPGRL